MTPKPSSATELSMTQIVMPYHANIAGNMHGGEVMKLMDTCAGVVAIRHCLTNVVTASVTQLSFIKPIYVGDLVTCTAKLIYTGRSSMEIFVSVKAEDVRKETYKYVSEGYFFMVSLDKNGQPTPVPPLLIENEEQQRLFDEAKQRINKIKQKDHDL